MEPDLPRVQRRDEETEKDGVKDCAAEEMELSDRQKETKRNGEAK